MVSTSADRYVELSGEQQEERGRADLLMCLTCSTSNVYTIAASERDSHEARHRALDEEGAH